MGCAQEPRTVALITNTAFWVVGMLIMDMYTCMHACCILGNPLAARAWVLVVESRGGKLGGIRRDGRPDRRSGKCDVLHCICMLRMNMQVT